VRQAECVPNLVRSELAVSLQNCAFNLAEQLARTP